MKLKSLKGKTCFSKTCCWLTEIVHSCADWKPNIDFKTKDLSLSTHIER